MTLTIEKTINLHGEEKEITFDVSLVHGGIGAYEFHGQKGYDRGGLEIDEITFDEKGLSSDEIEELNEMIADGKFDDEIMDKLADLESQY